MKISLIITVLAAVSLPAHGATFAQVRAAGAIDADAQTFLPNVTWNENPPPAYYRCTDRSGAEAGELWRGVPTRVSTPHSAPENLRYGEYGPVQVFIYTDAKRAVYLMLPSGETHLFRFSAGQEIVKSSMEWQCTEAPDRPGNTMPGE